MAANETEGCGPLLFGLFVMAMVFGFGGLLGGWYIGIARTRQEAVTAGAGSWHVDAATGEVSFRWNSVAK